MGSRHSLPVGGKNEWSIDSLGSSFSGTGRHCLRTESVCRRSGLAVVPQGLPVPHPSDCLIPEHADHSRTLIVSEPPPHVTLEGLGNLNPAVLANPLTRTVQIGYDGWVRDVVVRIDYTGDREIHTLIDRLHIYLFGSAYKSYALSIPPEGAPPRARRDLNIHISAADLDRWLFRSNGRFIPYNGSTAVPIATLLATGKSGLYYSEEPGVVRSGSQIALEPGRRHLREFALDRPYPGSDLLPEPRGHFRAGANRTGGSAASPQDRDHPATGFRRPFKDRPSRIKSDAERVGRQCLYGAGKTRVT